ncbi:MAG TPA: tetratricopeptide repeat protein [Chitinophagales bacterium]|jgi:hypothetical protein|nr:tetratricopeptide repeat protein [Chitinophagales bacterium]MBP6154616.1 tetratricopeptide repeat protein [Chitinophagales bacterium]HQV77180.1 tetratricopeptide repeat protein [Chitinophagales bacterium]HQW79679.1 tetratricopeptide repeat protein [Chitinophagales bacterium]HRB67035.1 tetratricopeptide repeat protein [Chitinophagales bacterium]
MKKIFLIISVCLFSSVAVMAENCVRYIDGDSTKTTAPYSIYREFFKKELYSEAYPSWKKIYEQAPGFRQQTFYDGITYYSDLIQKTTDNSLRQNYIDTLFAVYNKGIGCHGENAYILGKQGIDLLKYGKNTDIPQARIALEKNLNLTGDDAFPYYIQTYFKLLISQLGKDGITEEFVVSKYDELSVIVDKNIAKPNSKYLQSFKDVKVVLDDLFTQNFADKSNPDDCAKLLEIFLKKYHANPNDLETIKNVYTKTKGCADSALNVELLQKLNKLAPNYTYATRLANIYIKYKQYDTAIALYQNALAVETDTTKKGDLNYYLAFMKYAKEDFTAARDYAKEAIKYDSTNSRAYNLIAIMYLSSGPLCGPGTGFQSQIVLWPAFDYFNKVIALNNDTEIVAEAKKYIADYTQYLPTKADIQTRKLKVGDSYTVKCWINEVTSVKIK